MYIGYIQFLLIIFVFIKSLGENQVTEFIFNNAIVAIPILLLVFVLLSLIVGYLDSRLGLREEEIRNFSKSNPVLSEIQASINELSKKIEALDSKIEKSE